MAEEEKFGKLWIDSEDYRTERSDENRLVDHDSHFSDPEEFVDRVSDDGLFHMLLSCKNTWLVIIKVTMME